MAGAPKSQGGGLFTKTRTDGTVVFFYRYSVKGRGRFTEQVGTDRESADLERAKIRAAIKAGTWTPPDARRSAPDAASTTFEEFSKTYLRDWAGKRRTDFLKIQVRYLVAEFGKEPLRGITLHRLDRYVSDLLASRGAGTVNHRIRTLKNVFTRAVEWGYVPEAENPAAKLRLMKQGPPRERYYSRDETDRLLKFAPRHLKPIIQTALLTGMRRGEILGLTWDRVFLDRRMIYLDRTKNGKARWVPINDDLHKILKALPRALETNRVFTFRGKPANEVKHAWDTARDLAKVDGRFHDLRHTWASRAVMAGMDLATLQELGGWSDFTMVRRYAHFAPEHKINAAQLLNGTAG